MKGFPAVSSESTEPISIDFLTFVKTLGDDNNKSKKRAARLASVLFWVVSLVTAL